MGNVTGRRLSPAKAALLATLRSGGGSQTKTPRPASEAPTLGPAQARIWLVEQLFPGSAVHNLGAVVRIEGRIDLVRLRATLVALLDRHPILGSRYDEVDGECRPAPLDGFPGWSEIDLAPLPPEAREETARVVAEDMAATAIDLAQGPLRACVISLGVERHDLVLVCHHIAVDGWSLGILLREAERLYATPDEPAPPGAMPYGAHVAEQALDAESAASLAFWRDALQAPPTLNFPADAPRPRVPSLAARRVDFVLEPPVWAEIGAFAAGEGVSRFVVLMAAYQLTLARFCRQDRILVGTPVHGRESIAAQGVVGPLANIVVIGGEPDASHGFREAVAQAAGACAAAFRHAQVPFAHVVASVNPVRDPTRNPIFQAMLTFQNFPLPKIRLGEARAECAELPKAASEVDISVIVAQASQGAAGSLYAREPLFAPWRMESFVMAFKKLLVEGVRRPDHAVAEILDELGSGSAAASCPDAADSGVQGTLLDRIEAVGQARPDAVAYTDPQGAQSYRELLDCTRRVAGALRARGIRPGDVVAVQLERDRTLPACLLGVWVAGAAYLPLDPELPAARRERILRDSGARLLVVRDAGATGGATSTPEALLNERVGQDAGPGPGARRPGPGDCAYVIYTSGSTGAPKGVVIEHAALANCLQSIGRRIGMTETDVMPALSSIGFDIAALELFLPLIFGARGVLIDAATAREGEALAQRLRASSVTCVQATPATWRMLLEHLQGPADFTVLCGGEDLPADLAQRLVRTCPRVWNVYGPTEATIWCCLSEVRRGERVSIGTPIDNLTAHVVDAEGWRLPPGAPGELAIGGVGLMRGYVGDPALTAERVFHHPVAGRLYRTGDLAEQDVSGAFRYLGRLDRQIKLNGYRIEPAEIEHALLQHPKIVEAAVVSGAQLGRGRGLVAYIVANRDPAPSQADVVDHLRALLPAYMLPTIVIGLAHLPKTLSAKIDYARLPPPGPAPGAAGDLITPTERRVAAIWAELLEAPVTGPDVDFFASGGTSLTANLVVSRVRAEFGVKIALREIFEEPSVRSMAQLIERAG